MKEYQEHLLEYISEAYSMYSITMKGEWGNIDPAERYLEKYWLPKDEYYRIWKPIQDNIFINQGSGLPELVFSNRYEMVALRGGCLFLEEDFKKLKECFLKAGDKYFVIVENTFSNKLKDIPFRMKYSTLISWDELTSGGFISSVLLRMQHKEYFVFGETGHWGKYSANDYIWPLDIIGFKPELAAVFKKEFHQPKEEREELREWLPDKYKVLIE